MMNFNDIPEKNNIIPTGTIVKAKLYIHASNNPDDSMITISQSGTQYINCEFIVTEGLYAKHRIFHMIGVAGNDIWVDFGKRFIKNLLESAAGISRFDTGEKAQKARIIESYRDLDGLEVVLKIGIESGGEYPPRNKVLSVITADNLAYKAIMDNSDGWTI